MSKKGILQTLDRGLQVLQLLAAKELGPTDIGKELNIERTSVHRILRTLMHRSFVEKSERGLYRANLWQIIELAEGVGEHREQDWINEASLSLEGLRTKTGLSANLCVPGGAEMIYIMQVPATTMLAVFSPPGTRRPLYCSAVGKAYLGSLPDDELEAIITQMDLSPVTPLTVTSPDALKNQLNEGRVKGYYVDIGEINIQAKCVAAPIFDRTGRAIASLGVSGPSMDAQFAKISELGELVAVEAGKISEYLGYSAA